MRGAERINTNQVEIWIQSALLRCVPRAYMGEASDESAFPYAEWETQWIRSAEGPESGVLGINLWDRTKDRIALGQMADNIVRALDRTNAFVGDAHLSLFMTRRKPIEDESKDLRRIMLQFEIHYTGV